MAPTGALEEGILSVRAFGRNGGKTRKRKEKWDLAEKKILFG